MHPISDDMIERFVLSSTEMDPSRRADVAEHITRCASCRRIAEKLREFHAEMDTGEDTVPKSVDQFIAQLFKA